jgi:prophage regulatory protein
MSSASSLRSSRIFLSVRELSVRYVVSVATIWRWTAERTDFPKPLKLGSGCTRWRIEDLEVFEARAGEVLS